MIYPENFEQKIGFDKIRQMLKDNCLSTLGKERIDNIRFTTFYPKLKNFLNQVNEFKQICLFADNFPVSYYFDLRPCLEKIQHEGTFFELGELFDLKRSLDTVKNLIRFFSTQEAQEKYPYLQKLFREAKVYPWVSDKIGSVIGKNGEIKDNASPELLSIRKNLNQKENSISKITNSILKKACQEGWADSDVSPTIRDGKMLIPVPTSYKRKIKGIVHDQSATGKTSFVEPLEVIEINNDIRELYFEERREIVRILTNLADEIRPYSEDLGKSYDLLGIIDFIRAKALLAIKMKAILPKLTDQPITDIRNGRHPLLFLSFEKEGKKVVPLDIEITKKNRIVLISGPNAGGKSVCLKTVGLLQYMTQCGMLIPTNDTTRMGMFHKIFIDIGDEQSIENDLSTYSSHLKNMKHFIKYTNAKTLVLIDEFGTGTEPMLGGAIAEATLAELNEKETCGVITTHYSNLKHFASSVDGISNAAMLFDTKEMRPLFQLEIGRPGSSFAFEIAKNIGLSHKVLKQAIEKVGQDHIDFDKNLQDLEQEKRKTKSLKRELEQKHNQLNSKIEKYDTELNVILKSKKKAIEEARRDAELIVSTANKRIENTIAEIKKANAEKEKTKEIRKNLAEFKEDFQKKTTEEEEKINAKIAKINNRQEKKKTVQPTQENQKEEIIDKEIRVGDKVKMKGQNTVGEVLELKGKDAIVSFGNLRTSIKLNKIDKISRNEAKRLEKDSTPIRQTPWDFTQQSGSFKSGIDIRGKRAEEAIEALMKYMDQAVVANVTEIKVLHGKGNGILKQIIREYLNTLDEVKHIKDEHIDFGGSGISVVTLDFD